ncbi:MAG: cytochrome c assembly protein [Alphaproteobacteria bacterium]|nr:cytochrome c assembly protein [Alphaproteobacteria bacterium]
MVKKILIAVFFCLFCAAARAEDEFDFSVFQQLPVMHEGRLKPLGRFAQLTLQQISGVKAPMEITAPWLARLAFDPASGDAPPLFLVRQSSLLHVLDLPLRDPAYYSFTELDAAFSAKAILILSLRKTEADQLSPDQQELLTLYAMVTGYEQLKNSFTLLLPLKSPSGKPQRFIDLKNNGRLERMILSSGENNQYLRLIPRGGAWLSPWEYYLANKTSDTALNLWSDLADAYIKGDVAKWQETSREIYAATLKDKPLLQFQLKTELVYNMLDPWFLALVLYGVAFLLALLAMRYPVFKYTAWAWLGAGITLHGFGLLCRMIILQRPPVSTLYESILFIGFVTVAFCLLLAKKQKEISFLALGGFLGAGLKLFGYAINDEAETLKVLQAVLDTRFWLGVHVLTITTGYALCLLTSAMAHVYLWGRQSPRLFQRIYYASLLSLLFISIGTLLGGVWADQSWGRFWGWDPKENGALLIALWLIAFIHARLTRQVGETGFIIALCLLCLIVALSWIGINLLGIGLHSYGFMNGSASSLAILGIAELIFLILSTWRRRRHAAS